MGQMPREVSPLSREGVNTLANVSVYRHWPFPLFCIIIHIYHVQPGNPTKELFKLLQWIMAQFHELCDITEFNHIIQWAFASLGCLVLDFLGISKQINKQASLNTITKGWQSGWVVGLAKGVLVIAQWPTRAGLSPKAYKLHRPSSAFYKQLTCSLAY